MKIYEFLICYNFVYNLYEIISRRFFSYDLSGSCQLVKFMRRNIFAWGVKNKSSFQSYHNFENKEATPGWISPIWTV